MKKQIMGILVSALVIASGIADAATYTSDRSYNAPITNYNQYQQNVTSNVNVNFNGSGVDYDKGYVYATGTGIMDYGGMIGSEDLAREAAIIDAQRYLVGAVDGAQIDSESTVEMKRLKNDTITRKISGIVRGAVIVDEGISKSGQSYYVKMIMPLYGNNSVASAVMYDLPKRAPQPVPEVRTPVIPQPEVQKYRTVRHTGLVIDAQGFGLEPCMSPVIFDTNGRAIYGVKNIDADFAVNKGMVAYARGIAEIQFAGVAQERAGFNPLIIKAVGVRGGASSVNKVNVVVSPEDGDRILLANDNEHFLENCNVVFVR